MIERCMVCEVDAAERERVRDAVQRATRRDAADVLVLSGPWSALHPSNRVAPFCLSTRDERLMSDKPESCAIALSKSTLHGSRPRREPHAHHGPRRPHQNLHMVRPSLAGIRRGAALPFASRRA